MFCSSCGAQLAGGKFCASCGAPTVPQPANAQLTDQAVAPLAHAPAGSFTSAADSHYGQVAIVGDDSIFVLLSRIAAFALAGGLILWIMRFVLISDDYWDWNSRMDFLLGESLLHTLVVIALSIGTALVGFIQAKVWIRWLVVSLVGGIYWGLIAPIYESTVNGFEFMPTSPIQILIDNLPSLEFFLSEVGPAFTFSWFLSLVLSQGAPLLATFAMLGATIKNKRLS